jgi:UMP-CMP kinase
MTSNTTNTVSHPSDDATIPPFIYILNTPGAGKGTLCPLLAKHFTKIQHLSVGDLLCDLQANDQNTAQTLGGMDSATFNELMKDRTSLPASNIIAIVETALKTIASNATTNGTSVPTVLIDGFPRTLESAELANTTWGLPRAVFVFCCPRVVAEKRFLDRARSEDDSVETFRRRYDAFKELNPKIMALYGDGVVYVSTRMETAVSWEVLKARVGGLLEELESVEGLET